MDKLKYTLYLAAAIEHNPIAKQEKEDWKKLIKEKLNFPYIGIYDPVEREAQKLGKKKGETVEYTKRLKQGGVWNQFLIEMEKIWWGKIDSKRGDKIELIRILRNRSLVDGNYKEELNYWGDEEAVIRSNFIFAYMEKDVKTVGTIREIDRCYLLNIPVYLILPDQSKTEANSTLLEMVLNSGGDVFYSTKDAIKFVNEKYNIK